MRLDTAGAPWPRRSERQRVPPPQARPPHPGLPRPADRRSRGNSTRVALRRVESEKKARAAEDQRALEQKRNKAAEKSAVVICNWLEEHTMWPAHRENILDETRRILATNEANGTLPKFTAPEGTSLARIIERTRPNPPKADPEPIEVGSVAWYAEWLVRWTFFAFPNPDVRDHAIGLALNAEIRGEPLGKTS